MWDMIVSSPDHCLSFYFTANEQGPKNKNLFWIYDVGIFHIRTSH